MIVLSSMRKVLQAAVFSAAGFVACVAFAQNSSSTIRLNAGPIDTSAPAAKLRAKTLAQPTGKQFHLVQFTGPVQPEWVKDLKDSGFTIVNYIPDNAYVVQADASVIQSWQSALGSKPQVKWEGPYTASMKIQPGVASSSEAKKTMSSSTSDLYAIQLLRDSNFNADTVAFINSIALALPVRDRIVDKFRNIIVRLPNDQVSAVVSRPDVFTISRYIVPQKRDERQGMIVAGQLIPDGSAPTGPGYTNWLAGRGFTQAQFNASGLVVDVTDSGIDNGTTNVNHFALYTGGTTNGSSRVVYSRLLGTSNGPTSTLAGLDGHGNINAHIIGGMVTNTNTPHVDTNGYRYGLGVAPFVRVGASVIFDPNSFTFPDYSNLASLAYSNGARVSCNSWGASTAGAYDVDCQEYDYLVRDAQPEWSSAPAPGNQQMSFVFAAGNDGEETNSVYTNPPVPFTVGSPGTAKNVITVGAAENVRSLSTANGGNNLDGFDGSDIDDAGADNANDMIDFSSRGPCQDLRVKPDIVAPGTHITGGVPQNVKTNAAPGSALAGFDASGISALPGGGTVNNNNNFFPTNTSPRQRLYSVSSGTSQATPGVAGGAALVYQWFLNTNLPAPSPAMVKAFLMNAARYMDGAGANDDLYSNNQGMGMMNLGTAFDGTRRFFRDQRDEDLFTASGQSRTFIGAIPAGGDGKPLRITLAWTDAYGSTAGDAYVNNLDLVVEVNGDTYLGNNFVDADSVTDGVPDTRNNVESVFIPAGTYPAGSTVTISVNAINIAGDGVPNNGYELDQDFALVAYNLGQSAPAQVTGLVGTGLSDTSIGLSWSALTNADAYRILRITNGVTNDLGLTVETNFTDTGLRESTTYTFTVAGTNVGGLGPSSTPTNVTTLSWVAANPFGIRVTNPTANLATNALSQIFSGQIGAGLLGSRIAWTNSGTGISGAFTNSLSTSWTQSVGLVSGTNRVFFSATYPAIVGTNYPAEDSPFYPSYGPYNSTDALPWATGSGSGTGFGIWSNAVSGDATLTVVRGRGMQVANLDMGTNDFRAFALIGNNGVALASRRLNVPLAVGQSFVMGFDSNLLETGRSTGFALADSNGGVRFSFSAVGASTGNHYSIADGSGASPNTNTGIAYTTNGLVPVTFTLVTSNSYRFVAGTNAAITGTLSGTNPISMLVISNAFGGASYSNALYIGPMAVESYSTQNQTFETGAPLIIRPSSTAGIPNDWWEFYFAGNTAAWVAANDPDADGQSNAAEYAAGTSPTDATSKLAILSIGRVGTSVSITWSAVSNKAYHLESKGSLTTNWQTTVSNIVATNTGVMGTNLTVPGAEGYLRVRLAP